MASHDHKDTRKLIDFAAKAAESFVSAYYAATDAPHRVQLIPTLYLPDATIVWNGNPISGATNLAALLNSMPGTKHEVQTFDCHPLGGGSVAGTNDGQIHTPSLVLQVTGLVVHHTPGSLSAMPPSNAPKSASSTGTKPRGNPSEGSDPNVPLDSLARAFSQNFVLVSQPEQENGGIQVTSNFEGKSISGKFFVQADTFRFIG